MRVPRAQVRDLSARLNELKRLRNGAKAKADQLQVHVHEYESKNTELEAVRGPRATRHATTYPAGV